MIVCLCHHISDRDIAVEAGAGCASFDRLQEETRVATACGACLHCALETFEQHRRRGDGAARASGPAAAAMRGAAPCALVGAAA
jgi:bacterioferritin-associated ferredoxin